MNEDDKFCRVCIILSGGVGTRIGASTPKQYIEMGGKPILEYTLHSCLAWEDMDSLVIVADKNWHEYVRDTVERTLANKYKANKTKINSVTNETENGIVFLGFAEPGKNRQLSIYNALKMVKDHMSTDAWVMIHDGVRPCLSSELIERCNAAFETKNTTFNNNIEGADWSISGNNTIDGVMPYLEIKDTVYLKDSEGNISGMLDRSSLVAGQTPEFFCYWKYLKANEALSDDEMLAVHGSTEPAVKAGMKIALVPGDEGNFKITTRQDLERFKYESMGFT